jgi:acetylornithine deacetylase/succinyl-diaminopimelate desuccinylase-like protein
MFSILPIKPGKLFLLSLQTKITDNYMTINIDELRRFIAIKSIDGDVESNLNAINYVLEQLEPLGFTCKVIGSDLTDQPTLVAHHVGNKSRKKIVIYGHYDVAPVKNESEWLTSDPFKLELANNRLYGRGIADNKGPLFMRIEAIKELLLNENYVPEILWLIQGEEEITGPRVATDIFKDELQKFNSNVFIEETGFNDIDSGEPIAFLWSPNEHNKLLDGFKSLLRDSLNINRIEYRHLNKFNGIDNCPLLSNLGQDSIYIGFGPNDKFHKIHSSNESLNMDTLAKHKNKFINFMTHYAKS